jgi:hypothetical protein
VRLARTCAKCGLVVALFSTSVLTSQVVSAAPCPPSGVQVVGAPTLPDTRFPIVSIKAPLAGATVAGSVVVSACAADNIAVVGVQFKVDGTSLGAEDLVRPFSVTWNTSSATSGAHTLTAVARDAAGHVTTSAGVVVTIADSTPPVLSAITSSSITTTGATITWTTNEASNTQVAYGPTAAYGSTSTLNATSARRIPRC